MILVDRGVDVFINSPFISFYFLSALCGFEHGMCKYIKDTTGDFDWTRTKGATTSIGTGPSADHTLQTPQGILIDNNI